MTTAINFCIFSSSFDLELCALTSLFCGTWRCPEQLVNFCYKHGTKIPLQGAFDVLYAVKQYEAAI